MKRFRHKCGFTLIELLVAVTVTLVLAGLMLAVTLGTLDLWRRTQDNFSTGTQAKLVLDFLERDLQAAIFRADGQTWLAVDINNTSSALANHGWLTTGTIKPNTLESQRYLPVPVAATMPSIAEARFGLSGAWVRFITTNVDRDGSVPVAVAYQIARRPVSGTVSAVSPAEVRYTLFRSAVAAGETFAAGYDVLAAGYGSGSSSPRSGGSAATLMNPNTADDVIATNVVDFGIWLYARDATGNLTRIFPLNSTGTVTHRSASAAGYLAVADVMVRILTEEGAKRVAAIEQNTDAVTRPPGYATDAEWWWAVVEANSKVTVRRIEVKGAAQ